MGPEMQTGEEEAKRCPVEKQVWEVLIACRGAFGFLAGGRGRTDVWVAKEAN